MVAKQSWWRRNSLKVRKFCTGFSSLMWFSWVENPRGLQGILFQYEQSVFTSQAVMAWFNLLYNISIIFCRLVCLKWIWEKPQQFSDCPLNLFLPPFKWCHVCEKHAAVEWAAEPSVSSWKLCQMFSASQASQNVNVEKKAIKWRSQISTVWGRTLSFNYYII